MIEFAFISNYFDVGGVQKTILSIATSLRNKALCFHFINLGNDIFLEGFKQCGTCFHSSNPAEVIQYLQENRIDIVQTCNCDAGSYLAYLAGVPRIIERLAGMDWAFEFDKSPVDCIIASTDNGYKKANQDYQHKYIAKICNGVDLSLFQPQEKDRKLLHFYDIAKDEIVLGYCGRVSREKCIDRLIDVFHKTSKKYSVRLILLGDFLEAYYQKFILDKVRSLKLEKKVIFIKGTEEPSSITNLFDIGVLTSGSHFLPDGTQMVKKEGLSNAVMEMLAMGIPVVATASGETGTLIRDGINGYLVDLDDMDMFFEKLSYLIANKELRKEMGQNAHKFIKDNFSKDKMIFGYEKLYHYVDSEQFNTDYPDRRKDMESHFLSKNFEWDKSLSAGLKILVIRSGSKALCDYLMSDISRHLPASHIDILCHQNNYEEVTEYTNTINVYVYDRSDRFDFENMQDIAAEINLKKYDYIFFLSNNFMAKNHENITEIVDALHAERKIILTGLFKKYLWS